MFKFTHQETCSSPWNKNQLIGQKPPLKLQEVWEIRIRLKLDHSIRDLALFNLAIDSKLRGCDLVKLTISDVSDGAQIRRRSMVIQQKTNRPVQFEITKQTREALKDWINTKRLSYGDYLFPSRKNSKDHITTRQYARLVKSWIASIGLNPATYGTHSLRRTKATQIYKRTHNIRAVQLLLGHEKLESTVRYLGIEVDDALEIAEHTEV